MSWWRRKDLSGGQIVRQTIHRYAEEENASVLFGRTFNDAVLAGDGSRIRAPYADAAVKTLEFVLTCKRPAETGLLVRMHFEQ